MVEYKNKKFDEERALYNLHNAKIIDCVFDGPLDGESALKECSDLSIIGSDFCLRYPLWHVKNSAIVSCDMSDTCRAALWYDEDIVIESSRLGGIKALRECDKVSLNGCEINSREFSWLCRNISIKDTSLISEYPFFKCCDMNIDNLSMTAKYSFQYSKNVTIENSYLDTKDAFWHGKDIVVRNSVVKGEYLAWYSENITFENCKIIGTQPLCYVKGLRIIDCKMVDCDLAFERSEVDAKIIGTVDSIKNPISGRIVADSVGEIIHDDYILSSCEIIEKNK